MSVWLDLLMCWAIDQTRLSDPFDTFIDDQNKSSLKLGDSALQSQMDYPNPWIDKNYLSICKKPMTWILCTTPNPPKLYTI